MQHNRQHFPDEILIPFQFLFYLLLALNVSFLSHVTYIKQARVFLPYEELFLVF